MGLPAIGRSVPSGSASLRSIRCAPGLPARHLTLTPSRRMCCGLWPAFGLLGRSCGQLYKEDPGGTAPRADLFFPEIPA